jgi:hypothetical protein
VSDEQVNKMLSRLMQSPRHLRLRFCESSVAKKCCKMQMCRVLSGKVHFMIFLENQHKILSVKQLLSEEKGTKEGFPFSK